MGILSLYFTLFFTIALRVTLCHSGLVDFRRILGNLGNWGKNFYLFLLNIY